MLSQKVMLFDFDSEKDITDSKQYVLRIETIQLADKRFFLRQQVYSRWLL